MIVAREEKTVEEVKKIILALNKIGVLKNPIRLSRTFQVHKETRKKFIVQPKKNESYVDYLHRIQDVMGKAEDFSNYRENDYEGEYWIDGRVIIRIEDLILNFTSDSRFELVKDDNYLYIIIRDNSEVDKDYLKYLPKVYQERYSRIFNKIS